MTDKHLTLADVARYPRPGMIAPRRVDFTPDSRKVAYLFSAAGTLTQDLWTYEIDTGVRQQVTGEAEHTASAGETRSLDEELRRERSRTRESGVTSYHYVREGEDGPLVLLVPLDGAVHLARGDGALTRLEGTEGAVDARLSPDGSHVAFVRADELYVMPADGETPPRQLTNGAGNGVTNGLAEYIAQEEM